MNFGVSPDLDLKQRQLLQKITGALVRHDPLSVLISFRDEINRLPREVKASVLERVLKRRRDLGRERILKYYDGNTPAPPSRGEREATPSESISAAVEEPRLPPHQIRRFFKDRTPRTHEERLWHLFEKVLERHVGHDYSVDRRFARLSVHGSISLTSRLVPSGAVSYVLEQGNLAATVLKVPGDSIHVHSTFCNDKYHRRLQKVLWESLSENEQGSIDIDFHPFPTAALCKAHGFEQSLESGNGGAAIYEKLWTIYDILRSQSSTFPRQLVLDSTEGERIEFQSDVRTGEGNFHIKSLGTNSEIRVELKNAKLIRAFHRPPDRWTLFQLLSLANNTVFVAQEAPRFEGTLNKYLAVICSFQDRIEGRFLE